MWNLLRYIMGLNRLNRKFNFMSQEVLDGVELAALDAFMARFPRWGGAFLPPFKDSKGNFIIWRGGKRL